MFLAIPYSVIGTLQKQTNRKRLISSRFKNGNGSNVPKGTELQFFKRKQDIEGQSSMSGRFVLSALN